MGYRMAKLGEVILDMRTGLNPRQNFKLNTHDATNNYITVRELAGNCIVTSDKTDKVNDAALQMIQNRSHLQVGDVLFSATGTIGNTAIVTETPNNWNIKEGIYAITPDTEQMETRYLMHWIHSTFAKKQFAMFAEGGTVKSVSMQKMKQVKIPLPPLSEQRRIVEILDRFDALCNDLTAGLPAEIEARRKQYEHYRDRLLEFDRLDSGSSHSSHSRPSSSSPSRMTSATRMTRPRMTSATRGSSPSPTSPSPTSPSLDREPLP